MIKNLYFSVLAIFISTISVAQQSDLPFLDNLAKHCGKAYKGKIVSTPIPEDFKDKELIMHVISCEKGQVKIPFYVGDNLSRTWIFTAKDNGLIELKHDHRLEDGTPDEITFYGGTSPNSGTENFQMFPADQETVNLISATKANVWWVTIDDNEYSYNLRSVNREGFFSVVFDLNKPIETDKKPWGTK